MARRPQTKPAPSWKKWERLAKANGIAPQEYEHKRTEWLEAARDEGMQLMDRALHRFNGDSNTLTAFRSGLSAATVSKYRAGKWGRRGPMLTTWLALKPHR